MSLENFLNVLPRLSKEIAPKEYDMARSMRAMIYQYFEPLYEEIMKKTFGTTSRNQAGSHIEECEFEILSKVSQIKIEFKQPEVDLPAVLLSGGRFGHHEPCNRRTNRL